MGKVRLNMREKLKILVMCVLLGGVVEVEALGPRRGPSGYTSNSGGGGGGGGGVGSKNILAYNVQQTPAEKRGTVEQENYPDYQNDVNFLNITLYKKNYFPNHQYVKNAGGFTSGISYGSIIPGILLSIGIESTSALGLAPVRILNQTLKEIEQLKQRKIIFEKLNERIKKIKVDFIYKKFVVNTVHDMIGGRYYHKEYECAGPWYTRNNLYEFMFKRGKDRKNSFSESFENNLEDFQSVISFCTDLYFLHFYNIKKWTDKDDTFLTKKITDEEKEQLKKYFKEEKYEYKGATFKDYVANKIRDKEKEELKKYFVEITDEEEEKMGFIEKECYEEEILKNYLIEITDEDKKELKKCFIDLYCLIVDCLKEQQLGTSETSFSNIKSKFAKFTNLVTGNTESKISEEDKLKEKEEEKKKIEKENQQIRENFEKLFNSYPFEALFEMKKTFYALLQELFTESKINEGILVRKYEEILTVEDTYSVRRVRNYSDFDSFLRTGIFVSLYNRIRKVTGMYDPSNPISRSVSLYNKYLNYSLGSDPYQKPGTKREVCIKKMNQAFERVGESLSELIDQIDQKTANIEELNELIMQCRVWIAPLLAKEEVDTDEKLKDLKELKDLTPEKVQGLEFPEKKRILISAVNKIFDLLSAAPQVAI